METHALEFFRHVLETPSPSGYESPLQKVVRDYAAPFADEIRTDLHGNLIAVRNPDAPLRLMLAGHCDQIGLIVQHVDDNGFLYVQPIGGWDPQVLVGQRMTVWTEQGPVGGVIARKPIHLLTEEERKQVVKLQDLWIDIGANSKDDAQQRVRVGDCVTLELGFRQVLNGKAISPAMDDKCGLWVVIEALRRIDPKRLNCAVYAVSTVQEEVGLRGSRTLPRGTDDAAPLRLTIFLHAAPLSPRRTRMRPNDMMTLMSTVSSLLERVPARSVRLVLFNLDQQKELYRKDGFVLRDMAQVSRAMTNIELGLVDFQVLQNKRGHVDLLTDLVNREIAGQSPSDVVLFLGPATRYFDSVPQASLEKPVGHGTQFYYFQIVPFIRQTATLGDTIKSAISRLGGKTIVIHTPGEFAKAIERLEKGGRGSP